MIRSPTSHDRQETHPSFKAVSVEKFHVPWGYQGPGRWHPATHSPQNNNSPLYDGWLSRLWLLLSLGASTAQFQAGTVAKAIPFIGFCRWIIQSWNGRAEKDDHGPWRWVLWSGTCTLLTSSCLFITSGLATHHKKHGRCYVQDLVLREQWCTLPLLLASARSWGPGEVSAVDYSALSGCVKEFWQTYISSLHPCSSHDLIIVHPVIISYWFWGLETWMWGFQSKRGMLL